MVVFWFTSLYTDDFSLWPRISKNIINLLEADCNCYSCLCLHIHIFHNRKCRFAFSQLLGAAIKHKFIGLPIENQTFHRKNTPVHWGKNYPIKQECSLAQQKTFIGLKVSFMRKQPKYSLVSSPIRVLKKLRKLSVSLEIRNFRRL